MPRNGEINRELKTYRNLCCGEEVTLAEGAAFPDCGKHPNLSTVWKPAQAAAALKLGRSEPIVRHIPVFQPGDQVKVVAVDARKGTLGIVAQVLESVKDFVHRYDVTFADGATSRYFGFQLELIRPNSAKPVR